MIRTLVSSAVAGLIGYGVTKAVLHSPLRTHRSTVRTNHAGRDVSLVEGPAVAAGLLAGSVLIEDPRQRAATLLATSVSGALGAVDDFMESGSSKGLRGHLSALAHGEITTGAIKVTGIPVAAIVAAAVLGSEADRRHGLLDWVHPAEERSWWQAAVETVVTGGVIAGTANLFNLLDLRPGRALKAGLLVAGLMPHQRHVTCVPTAVVTGTSIAAWPDDLDGSVMLGDTGANALGAAIGTTLSANLTPKQRAVVLAVLVGLTLASEKVSFTTVIESTPGLREIDAFGRAVK
ncbi:hypothetical protein [Brevibacterium casei]